MKVQQSIRGERGWTRLPVDEGGRGTKSPADGRGMIAGSWLGRNRRQKEGTEAWSKSTADLPMPRLTNNKLTHVTPFVLL